MASQEMRDEGLSAAHPSLPIGSKVRVTSLESGIDVEATIVRRIPESVDRIIDISPGVARSLGFDIGRGGPVLVTMAAVQPFSPVLAHPAEEFEPVAAGETAIPDFIEVKTITPTEKEAEKLPIQFHVTINNYITDPESRHERPARRHRPLAAEPAWESPAPPVASQPELPPAEPPMAPSGPRPVFTNPPVNEIQVVPGLPNPNNDKIYRLMVGSYAGADSAFSAYQQVQIAGFDAFQEYADGVYKVFAVGLAAPSVYYAARRLGAVGFSQVWVYE